MSEQFWMVYGKGASGALHKTEALAVGEARRLAAANRNMSFFVLCAVSEHRDEGVTSQRLGALPQGGVVFWGGEIRPSSEQVRAWGAAVDAAQRRRPDDPYLRGGV